MQGRVSGMLYTIPIFAVMAEDLGERGARRVAYQDLLNLKKNGGASVNSGDSDKRSTSAPLAVVKKPQGESMVSTWVRRVGFLALGYFAVDTALTLWMGRAYGRYLVFVKWFKLYVYNLLSIHVVAQGIESQRLECRRRRERSATSGFIIVTFLLLIIMLCLLQASNTSIYLQIYLYLLRHSAHLMAHTVEDNRIYKSHAHLECQHCYHNSHSYIANTPRTPWFR